MRKVFLILLMASCTGIAFSQDSTATLKNKKKDWAKISLNNRTSDHFIMQFGWLGWNGAPDSLNTRGWSKTFNIYLMLDFPFKTDPRFSLAAGLGWATDNMFFNRRSVDVAGNTQQLAFQNLDSSNHFKKYKLATSYLEVPVEFRFSSNPEDPAKAWKFAIGAKAGLILDAHTKGKTLVDKNGNSVPGSDYVEKIRQRKYFNAQRVALTARVGYGNFSLWGSYQLTTLIKDGRGPDIRPVNIGICLSGL